MFRSLTLGFLVSLLVAPVFVSAATLEELQGQLEVLLAQIAALQAGGDAAPTESTNPVAPITVQCPNLSRSLSRGMQGADVTELQRFLISQGHLASDLATGYFGSFTEKAVQKFQCKELQICSGTPSSNGFGVVGSMTRTAIRAVCTGTVPVPVPVSAPAPVSAPDAVPGQSFTVTPLSGTVPLTVTFSTYPVGDEESYVVQFGDGTEGQMIIPSNEFLRRTVQHTYAVAGTYTARLIKKELCAGMGSCVPSREVARTTVTAAAFTSYSWVTGEWGACSGGTQTRSVSCKNASGITVADSFCTVPKPVLTQTCTVGTQSCTFNGQTVAHGASVTAYQSPSVPAGQACASQSRTCTNGTLSGTYTNASCSVASSLLPNPTVKNMEGIRGGFRNVYAPSVATVQTNATTTAKRMWLCGWKTDADPNDYNAAVAAGQSLTSIVGPDKIWMSEFNGTTWSDPVLSFQKVGFHVCDPSIVRPPSTDGVDRSQWTYMYYTGLDNRFAASPTDQVQNNVTGLASSVDGGTTWTDLGIKLDKADGGDGFGAWAASALVAGDEIWLYYTTGNQNFNINATYRQRMNANGWQKIGAPEPLTYAPGLQFNEGTQATLLSNLHVHKEGSKYVMLANTYDLKRVVRLISDNGLAWRSETVDPVIMNSGANFVITPFGEPIDSQNFSLYFGYGDTPPALDSHGVHRWTFGW